MPDAQILMDTHVWLWMTTADARRLSKRAQARLRRVDRAKGLLVSVMSVWEVAMLESRSRLDLDMECGAWVRRALADSDVSLFPLTPAIAVASTRLPGEFHGDPTDRILIASALETGAVRATADDRILRYAATKKSPLRVLGV